MRKLLSTIVLTISLALLITIYVLSITLKGIVEDGIRESWSSIVNINPFQTGNDSSDGWFSDYVDEEEIKDIFHSFLPEDSDDTKDKIKEFIEDNKEKLEDFTGVEFSNDMIYDISNAIQNNDLEGLIDKYKSVAETRLTPQQKMALKVYRFLVNAKLKGIVLILIVVHVVLIALVQFSLYKWIKPFAWSLALSGALLFGCDYALQKIFSMIGFSAISTSILLKYATILSLCGIAIRVLYLVLSVIFSNLKKNKKREGEE